MFRLLFWLLLLANLVLLTLLPGPLPWTATLEPQRLVQQVQPDSVKLIPNPQMNDSAKAEPAKESCVELGDFSATTAIKFESRLAKLKLPSLPLKQQVQSPQASLVFIPPQSRWGISVGLFTSPELAAAQLENLKKAGITDARIEEHPLNSARFSYQLKGYAGEDKPELKALIAEFSGVALRSCKH